MIKYKIVRVEKDGSHSTFLHRSLSDQVDPTDKVAMMAQLDQAKVNNPGHFLILVENETE
jgi:hypothetical protein